MTSDDMALVREFAASRSEEAFAQLVGRHIHLVHSAALRRLGDAHLAEEVTQSAFITLARKAGSLGPRTILSGWLYRTMAFAAADALKSQRRRQQREQEAFMQSNQNEPPADEAWTQLAPLLENALDSLAESERNVVILRFLEGKSLEEVGQALGFSPEAARMRASRALEKLRKYFAKRGVTLAASTIVAAVVANAVKAAPAGLVLTVKAASLVAAGPAAITLAKFMTMTQIKFSLATLMVAGAATAFVVQQQAQTKLRGENDSLRQRVTQLETDPASFSNRMSSVANNAPPNGEHQELLQLRGEVGVLRGQVGELAKLREANQPLLAAKPAEPIPEPGSQTPEEKQQATAMAKLSNAKQGVLAMLMFAQDNQQQYPTNLSQAAAYLNGGMDQIETNFNLVYQGSLANITNSAETIVLAEKQAWQALEGKWMKTYGFADGHAVIHTEPNGSFDQWESQHMVLPPQN